MLSRLEEKQREMETRAIGLLKAGIQPLDVQKKTGLNLVWIEMKARGLGIQPLTVEGIRNG